MEKSKPKKENYSYSELNEIRAKSANTIREIREKILSQNINSDDNAADSGFKGISRTQFNSGHC
jgi:hypothetical protein